jgi:hypothetical protein
MRFFSASNGFSINFQLIAETINVINAEVAVYKIGSSTGEK